MTTNPTELKGALEAIIYAADEPATLDQIANAVGEDKSVVLAALDEMVSGYAGEDRGMEIRLVAGGYRFYTKPQHHDLVRRFIKSLRPPLRLTMPALETLAVISYRQPVTGPEIQEIRGVNVSGVIKTLLEKRLIVTAGRKAVMGRPVLYRTSKEFLMRFGLSDLEELPSLKEFEQLARAALGADEGIAAIEPESDPMHAQQELAVEIISEGEERIVSSEISSSEEYSVPLEADAAVELVVSDVLTDPITVDSATAEPVAPDVDTSDEPAGIAEPEQATAAARSEIPTAAESSAPEPVSPGESELESQSADAKAHSAS
jgi:segregation and condensation protein B